MKSAVYFILLLMVVVVSAVTARKLSNWKALNDVVKFTIEDKKASFVERLLFDHLTHDKETPRTRLGEYKYTNCGDPQTDLANLTGVFFAPDPIELPGPLTVNFTGVLKQALESPLKADVVLQREIGSTWITIPCIGNIGSCNYADICPFLVPIPACPSAFKSRGIPCKCPFKAGNYSLPSTTFQVKTPVFPTGNYRVSATVRTSSDKRVGCAKIQFSFA